MKNKATIIHHQGFGDLFTSNAICMHYANKFGNLFSFNGNQLRHGNLINTTSCTRVSMDFRLISKEDYDKSNKLESITTKTKFEIGKYYEEM